MKATSMLSRIFLVIAAVASMQAAGAQELVLAVNEGVTYQDAGPAKERYKPLLELLEKELKRPVRVQSVDKYADFERGLAVDKYDLVFIHPAQIGLRAVRSGMYSGVATAKGFTDYRGRVMVKKESIVNSMDDLRGKKIGVPSLESITTFMFIATLREMKFSQPEKTFTATRYQDAVPFMVENGFVEAGVTGSGKVAKEWTAKGGRVIAETKPVPIKQFLVSKRLGEAGAAKVQALMLNLSENEAGKNALEKIGIKGFVPWNAEVMNQAADRFGL